MTVKFTDSQITEAEIELATEIAVRVLDFLKESQGNVIHEAICSRIEKAMRKKAEARNGEE